MTRKAKESLRCGFTTGASAAAAGMAAYRFQVEKQLPERVDLLFPDGQIREFKITLSDGGFAQVIKDAGDDPDITDKARISASFLFVEIGELRSEDYVIDIGLGKLILRGGAGVGLCHRRGLDCDAGKWAINKVPRRMIVENLKRAGFGKVEVCGLLTIEVANGRKLALKTLNAKLGIEGGISILGTSGIVYPYSHKAYIKTIAVLVKAVADCGGLEVVFCTGGRTLKRRRNICLSYQMKPLSGLAILSRPVSKRSKNPAVNIPVWRARLSPVCRGSCVNMRPVSAIPMPPVLLRP